MSNQAEPQRDPRTEDGPPGMPRWVKASAIVVGVVLVVIVAVLLLSGGEHGPGRHLGGAPTGGDTTAALGA